jgi:hypothetical protein
MRLLFSIHLTLILFSAGNSLFADTIYFTDGKSLSGTLLRVTENQVEYMANGAAKTVDRSTIAKVVYTNGKTVVISEKSNVPNTKPTQPSEKPESVQTANVKPDTDISHSNNDNTVKIAPVLSYKSFKILGYEEIKKETPFTLRSQSKIVPGIKTGYGGFTASVFNSVPYENKGSSRSGLNRFFEADAQYYNDHAGVEIFYKKINKYILEDNSKLWTSREHHSRDDVKAYTFGADLIFATNRDYSLKAGMGQNGLQKEFFTHSFICMFSAGYVSVKSSDPFDPRSTYYEKSVLNKASYSYIYFLPGYAISLCGDNIYFSTSLFLFSLGRSMAKYNDIDGNRSQNSVMILQPAFRVSLGYESSTFFTGFSFNIRDIEAAIKLKSGAFADMNLSAEDSTAEFFAGIKF